MVTAHLSKASRGEASNREELTAMAQQESWALQTCVCMEEQWPPSWGPFPPYASGTGYVLSASAVQLILKVASRAPLLPLEDVFVGLSARRGGLAPTHCVKLAGATHYPLDRCCYGKFLLTSHKLDPWEMQEAWKLVGGSDGERTVPFCSWLQGLLGILRCRLIAWLHS